MQGPSPIQAQGEAASAYHDIEDLAHQNAQILKSLEFLIRSHELEITQRQALQEKLDRLIEDIESGRVAGPASALGEDIRKGVSDDLKPLLHAVIDLLDLATRHAPAAEGPSREAKSKVAGPEPAPGDRASAEPEPDDELPRALPEILTKSVAELVGSQGNRRANGAESKAAPRTQWGKAERDRKPSAGTRARVWIPVAPGTPES